MDREKILLYSEKKKIWESRSTFWERERLKSRDAATVWKCLLIQKGSYYRISLYSYRYRLPSVKACAARVAECALGKPVMEAYLINAAQLSEFFGGLEKESIHCAQMAEIGLKRTLQDYAVKRAERISKQA